MKKFADRLKEIRREKNITQTELAKATGYSQAIVSQWERDVYSPQVEAIVAIADYFDVSADYLLGREDEFENSSALRELTQQERDWLKIFNKMNAMQAREAADYIAYLLARGK